MEEKIKKNENKVKKWTKMRKNEQIESKKKQKTVEKKKWEKKERRAQRGYLPPEMGPKVDFFT